MGKLIHPNLSANPERWLEDVIANGVRGTGATGNLCLEQVVCYHTEWDCMALGARAELWLKLTFSFVVHFCCGQVWTSSTRSARVCMVSSLNSVPFVNALFRKSIIVVIVKMKNIRDQRARCATIIQSPTRQFSATLYNSWFWPGATSSV